MSNTVIEHDDGDDVASEDDEIPTLCDLDEADPKLPPVPVTILTGFLGCGKTSLVRHILSSEEHQKRIAVIENEFGGGESDTNLAERLGLQVNDASTLSVETMIAKDGTDGSSLADFIELPNGCVCCTVKDSLIETLESLLAKRTDLDYIIIECSGMADPGPVASVFWVDDALESRIRLDGVVTLVDAKNILHQLKSTSSTSSRHGDDGDGGDEAARQIAYADRIIVNKIDLLEQNNKVNGDSLQSVLGKIKDINPTASLRQTTFSKIDIDWVIDANCFDAERIRDVEVEFQQSLPSGKAALVCFNPKCSVDHSAMEFCGLCEPDSSSPSVAIHQHTNTVGTIALFHVGSIDLHKLNSWLASILWPDQDEKDKVLRARLEESLRKDPKNTPPKVNKSDGSIIYRAKGVVSVQHLIDPTGNVVRVPNNDIDDEERSSSFINKSNGLDDRRYILQAVHDLWDTIPSKNLFWDPNDTRCCKIIVIGKRLDEKALQEGFMKCFS
mmetsp:Transcript_17003/g.27822  ORF Transcript_17003/g.27822 Transcript_17003/m.27822 type:complete len:500 (+) Transcript_17003:103-1602(+)